MKRHLVSTLGYIVATFAVQAASHFCLNRGHYAAVSFMRPDPIFALGILSMVLQGGILSFLYASCVRESPTWKNGLGFGLLAGVFFVSYPALAEPAKYQVPAVGTWMAVEGVVGLIQFSIFGLLVGWIHSHVGRARPLRS
jgi:branched-subunit amino acid transport protein AzlD